MVLGGPVKDYYKESKRQVVGPAICPSCHRRGKFVANLYEVGKRIPRVMSEGLCFCHTCHRHMMGGANAAEKRVWVCAPCQICVCASCHEKMKQ